VLQLRWAEHQYDGRHGGPRRRNLVHLELANRRPSTSRFSAWVGSVSGPRRPTCSRISSRWPKKLLPTRRQSRRLLLARSHITHLAPTSQGRTHAPAPDAGRLPSRLSPNSPAATPGTDQGGHLPTAPNLPAPQPQRAPVRQAPRSASSRPAPAPPTVAGVDTHNHEPTRAPASARADTGTNASRPSIPVATNRRLGGAQPFLSCRKSRGFWMPDLSSVARAATAPGFIASTACSCTSPIPVLPERRAFR
jgi:hypothetical protein